MNTKHLCLTNCEMCEDTIELDPNTVDQLCMECAVEDLAPSTVKTPEEYYKKYYNETGT